MELSIVRLCCAFLLVNLFCNSALAASAEIAPAATYAFWEDDPSVVGPPCGTETLDVSEVGNQLRLTQLGYALMVSEDPRLTGLSTVNVVVTLNNVSQHGTAHGTLTLEPAGFAGTWEASFHLRFPPTTKALDFDGVSAFRTGRLNLRGTGVFEGQWLLFSHAVADVSQPFELPVADPDGPGGCDFFGEVWGGRILDPNNG